MSKRTAAWFLVITLALMVAGVLLSLGRESVYDTSLYGLVLPGVLAGSGALVARAHPANPIGWLFCGFALFTALAELAEGYGHYAIDSGLPGGVWGEWVISWSWIAETTLWLLIFMLFPDGRLVSERWRLVLWLGLTGTALALPGQALSPGSRALFTDGVNPVTVQNDVVELLFPAGMALVLVALLGAIASLGVRLRRSRGIERQQLKWFAGAASLMVAVSPFALAFWYSSSFVQLPMALAIGSIPVAATVAILRYRLYDIDVVINRTLVYAGLSATLAGAYLGSVLVLQFALQPLTDRSDLAVAGSTLAVAALFRPARARIQAAVDRRFYRRRYDAARTLEDFGGRLRAQLDLEALGADLRDVVRDTVAPAHVSLWLPAPELRR